MLAGMPQVRFLGNAVRRMTGALREARNWRPFKPRLCPALSGIELLKDGGYARIEVDPGRRFPPDSRSCRYVGIALARAPAYKPVHMITRTVGRILRGKATPFQLFTACVLGAMLGFIPGFAQAPGLMIAVMLCPRHPQRQSRPRRNRRGPGQTPVLLILPITFRVG
jgi:hypothetical protein